MLRMLVVLGSFSILTAADLLPAEAQTLNEQSSSFVGPLDRPVPRKPLVGHATLHDSARPLVRIARSGANETAPAGVGERTSLRFADARITPTQSGFACDSIFCPGYAMIGVGF